MIKKCQILKKKKKQGEIMLSEERKLYFLIIYEKDDYVDYGTYVHI